MSHEVTVHFHGYMIDPITVVAETVAQAIETITRQLKEFKPHPITGRQRIKVVGYEDLRTLFSTLTEAVTVNIVRQFCGGAKGGFIQILLGAALIAGAFALGIASPWGGILLKTGAMMLLGGLLQLLSPAPGADDPKKNHYLGTPKNTVAIGTHIPVLYGKFRVYGHYLGFDINASKGDLDH